MAGAQDTVTVENYIGGKYVAANSFIDSFDPSCGRAWAKIPDSGKEEIDHAVETAKAAFETWSKKPVQERSRLLMKIADLIESRLDEFAAYESRDQGKTITMAKTVDIPRTVHNFRFFASSILHHLDTSSYMEAVPAINYTTRAPIGVVGLISPWNLPLYLLSFKIAPAIACGNTVVCKPSEMTSVTAWMMCRVFDEAGLPAGVVNMVFGTGPRAGDALIRHPDVIGISFTGSTLTAQKIREATTPFCKKLSLELGGKNAGIIFADADLNKCIPTSVRSSFANQGEICLCTSRLFVQRPIYEKFVQQFVEQTRKITTGDPRLVTSQMGALISKEHLAKVQGYVGVAREEGASVLCGHGVDKLSLPPELQHGYFMLPTVITDVKDTSRLMQEEIFGPVTCIVPFDTEAEVVERANNVPYGLAATVWSQDVGSIHRVARQLQVGTVWANCWLVRDLNMPFGGVKASGVGREGAHESLEFFTDVKTVCLQVN
jgi:acyl-CoA reductase-like NAD-dependent aldehyde dehydrogenase